MKKHSVHSKGNSSWLSWTIILALVLVVIVSASVYVIRYSVSRGVSTAKDAFINNFNTTKDETYNEFYKKAYEIAEAAVHVHNDISISVHSVKEKAALEVLHVSDVVYITSDSEDTKSGTTAWLKVPGKGCFTVNLTAAEYVIDNNRHSVLVRVPQPELDPNSISFDAKKLEILHFSEQRWKADNSAQSGEKLLQNQMNEAMQRIQEDFESNEQYSKWAESSARAMIIALIKSINPDVDDLEVEVEFYESSGSMG